MYSREQKPKKARKKLKYPFKVKKKPPIQDPYQFLSAATDVPIPTLPSHPLVEEIKKAYLKK